jgi:hypothetical protein
MLRKQRFLIAWIVLVLAGLACTQALGPLSIPSSGQNPAGAPDSNSSPTPFPSDPIGLRQGLSSLNSYRLTMKIINDGPTSQDKNQVTITEESGTDGKSSHLNFTTITSSADSPEQASSTTDQYMIGNSQCIFSSGDSEAAKSDMDPMMKEIFNTWYTLIDLVPRVSDPVFIGEEDVNGVRTNHFMFKVNGLGVDSGAEVVSSIGEYWLAQDGQYIVKYYVVIETRSGPAGDVNTKTMHSEFHIEVTDINQNIVITLPGNCQ